MIAFGWYRRRSGPPREVDTPSIGWSRASLANPKGCAGRITFTTHRETNRGREVLRLELTYDEMRRVIVQASDFMMQYPEPEGVVTKGEGR